MTGVGRADLAARDRLEEFRPTLGLMAMRWSSPLLEQLRQLLPPPARR
jgi:hypothetical protein